VAEGDPLYVVRLDAARRQVIVGSREALLCRTIHLKNVNWLGPAPLDDEPVSIHVKIRSTRPAVPAEIRREGQGAIVALPDGEYGVSPGQACVFYGGQGAGQRVLGGATIVSVPVLPKSKARPIHTGAVAGE
jgi:tRNA-specific 2-thiouridylase